MVTTALSITQVLNPILKWQRKKKGKKKRKEKERRNSKTASHDAQGSLLSGFYLNNPIQQIEAEFFKTKVQLEKDWLTLEQAADLRAAWIINFNNFPFILLRKTAWFLAPFSCTMMWSDGCEKPCLKNHMWHQEFARRCSQGCRCQAHLYLSPMKPKILFFNADTDSVTI